MKDIQFTAGIIMFFWPLLLMMACGIQSKETKLNDNMKAAAGLTVLAVLMAWGVRLILWSR